MCMRPAPAGIPVRASYEPFSSEPPPPASPWGALPQRRQDEAQYHILGGGDDAEYPAPGQPTVAAGGQYDASVEEQEDAELQAALQVSAPPSTSPSRLGAPPDESDSEH
jgi:hypothetical protein